VDAQDLARHALTSAAPPLLTATHHHHHPTTTTSAARQRLLPVWHSPYSTARTRHPAHASRPSHSVVHLTPVALAAGAQPGTRLGRRAPPRAAAPE